MIPWVCFVTELDAKVQVGEAFDTVYHLVFLTDGSKLLVEQRS